MTSILFILIYIPSTFQLGVLKDNSIVHSGPSKIFKTERLGRGGSLVFTAKKNNGFIEVYSSFKSKAWYNKEKVQLL